MGKPSKTGLGIRAVAVRSGLSQHLIRIWEKRYGVVDPERTHSNRRLYSESDVHRLVLLNRATQAGHRISDIATLPTGRLEKLVEKGLPARGVVAGAVRPAGYLQTCLDAVVRFDAEALDAALSQAEVELGQTRTLEQLIMPLMERVGAMWQDGSLRVAHEHMATAMVRSHIGSQLTAYKFPANAPAIVVSTPAGQMHDIGALVVAVAAALEGWRPVYLGASLPADEIAGAVEQTGAVAVALSLVFPSDDPKLPGELQRLRRLVPARVTLMIGGAAAGAYAPAISQIGAVTLSDLKEFRRRLSTLRAGARMDARR